jgi:hypothetical protein
MVSTKFLWNRLTSYTTCSSTTESDGPKYLNNLVFFISRRSGYGLVWCTRGPVSAWQRSLFLSPVILARNNSTGNLRRHRRGFHNFSTITSVMRLTSLHQCPHLRRVIHMLLFTSQVQISLGSRGDLDVEVVVIVDFPHYLLRIKGIASNFNISRLQLDDVNWLIFIFSISLGLA